MERDRIHNSIYREKFEFTYGSSGDKMTEVEKPSVAFLLSLMGGVFIILRRRYDDHV